MRRLLLLATLGSCLAASASSQAALYDAGTAGNPPQPPDPQAQGWDLNDGGAGVGLSPIANDGGLNAWEIADAIDGLGGHAWYGQDLYADMDHLLDVGWEMTVTLKMTAGDDASIFMGFANGTLLSDSLWQVYFAIVGSDVQVPAFGGSWVCPGGADGSYHTFTLRQQDPVPYGDAEFLYDGVLIGIVPESIPYPCCSFTGPSWGSFINSGTGRGRFHRVEVRALDDLGPNHCGPAVPNSTGASAAIAGWGSTYANENLLELRASSLPPNQFGYLLASLTAGFVQNPGGSQGNLCLSGNIGRFTSQVQSSGAGGSFAVPVDLGAIPTTPVAAVAPGETWNFQCWYRDQNPVSTSNFTDALRVTFR